MSDTCTSCQEPAVSVTPSSKCASAGDRLTPPRAPLTLRIGITGHRSQSNGGSEAEPKREAPNAAAVRAAVAQVLAVIQEAFIGVADTSADLFEFQDTLKSSPGGRKGNLRLISALAEGADQWVADEAVKRGYELQCILPFDREEYRKDFAADSNAEKEYRRLLDVATAVLELDGKVDSDPAGKRDPDAASYEAVGRAVLNQTDLLIAIWDGGPTHGRGGTGQIVKEALQRGIPVVWVPWATPDDWRLQTPLWRLLDNPEDIKGDKERLMRLVRDLLLPPADHASAHGHGRETRREDYFSERQKRSNLRHGLWLIFRGVVCGELFSGSVLQNIAKACRIEGFEEAEREKSASDWVRKKSSANARMEYPVEPDVQSWVEDRYTRHYAWANGLSLYYGNLYRSAFLANYLLGAAAVFLALVYVCTAHQNPPGKAEAFWILAELIVIAAILMLTSTGRGRLWHQRWIDYRMLAERLRLARALSLLGGGSPQVAYAGHLASYGNPARTWMHWHYLNIERAAGIPPVKFTREYLSACQEFWRESLLQDQRDYHHENALRFEKLDGRLHQAGDCLFIATLAACVSHLAFASKEELSGWLTLLSAFLPALGAAFAAIRSQCEAQRVAQRSRAMGDTMEALQLDMASMAVVGNSLESLRLRASADRVCELMMRELLDWRVVFQDRPLGLPA